MGSLTQDPVVLVRYWLAFLIFFVSNFPVGIFLVTENVTDGLCITCLYMVPEEITKITIVVQVFITISDDKQSNFGEHSAHTK